MNIHLGNTEFKVEIERKKIKNMYLRIPKKNHLMITAHPSVVEENIMKFIQTKQKWILEANEKLQARLEAQENDGTKHSSIRIWGKKRLLHVQIGKQNYLKIDEEQVTLQTQSCDPQAIQHTFEQLAKKELQRTCEQMRPKLDAIMDSYHLAHPSISFRTMTSKWGSCTPAKAKINMNVKLIYYPIECLYYVLLHEYVHMIVPNHSKRFWDVVAYHMPNYQQVRQILREK